MGSTRHSIAVFEASLRDWVGACLGAWAAGRVTRTSVACACSGQQAVETRVSWRWLVVPRRLGFTRFARAHGRSGSCRTVPFQPAPSLRPATHGSLGHPRVQRRSVDRGPHRPDRRGQRSGRLAIGAARRRRRQRTTATGELAQDQGRDTAGERACATNRTPVSAARSAAAFASQPTPPAPTT